MKYILFTFVATLFAMVSFAQDNQFGIKAGVNFSNYIGSEASDAFDSKTSFYAGGFASFPIAKRFAIQPELIYSRQGTQDSNNGIGDVKINLNYLNLPILTKFNVAGGLSVLSGPQLGVLLSAKTDIKDVDPTVDGEENIKSRYKDTDFGWVFGAEHQLSFGLVVEARYNLGISKLFAEGNQKVSNGVLQLGIRYGI